jgi:pimeloyl-ACP methyl ester carboxylesterase
MIYKNIQRSKLFYLDQGKGFPLLLGHSYLFDHTMWQPQMAKLTQHYRVIAT